VLVASVEEALKIGADAVSIQVNVGADNEGSMLSTLGEVSRSSQEWGMPLLAMMYPRGKKIKDEFAPEAVAHAARVGAELDLLGMVEGAIAAGARGVAISRNVFQHESPTFITRRICSLVHQGLSAKEALEISSVK